MLECNLEYNLNKLNVYLQLKLNYELCCTYESYLFIFPIIKFNWRNFLANNILFCYIYISFVVILMYDK
jgi:hypothetical protein